MIVLDTNVVSELIKPMPVPAVIDWVDAREPAELVITAITAAELRAGVAVLPGGRRRNQLGARIDTLLAETFADSVLPFTVDAAGHYATVVAERRRNGTPISGLDAQIAGVCLQHGATLATRNVRDFEGTGIDIVDPWGGPH